MKIEEGIGVSDVGDVGGAWVVELRKIWRITWVPKSN